MVRSDKEIQTQVTRILRCIPLLFFFFHQHCGRTASRSYFIRVTFSIRNHRFRSIPGNLTIFYDIFIIQVHKNVVKCLSGSHGNIDKNFCKKANNIFHIENSGNFKTNFFLNLYLQIFPVKQVSSANHSFYGLPL